MERQSVRVGATGRSPLQRLNAEPPTFHCSG